MPFSGGGCWTTCSSVASRREGGGGRNKALVLLHLGTGPLTCPALRHRRKSVAARHDSGPEMVRPSHKLACHGVGASSLVPCRGVPQVVGQGDRTHRQRSHQTLF